MPMPESDILSKCESCGKFINLDNAFYSKDEDDYFVLAFCGLSCSDHHDEKLRNKGE